MMTFKELKEKFEDEVITDEEWEMINEHSEVLNFENCGTSGQDPSKVLWVATNKDGDEFEVLA